MIRLTRFERKIVAAIAAVALVPFVAALLLGQQALREAYQVGVNQRVRGELERALVLYQRHFRTLRSDAERTRHSIARDWELRGAIASGDAPRVERQLRATLSRYPDVGRVVVLDAAGRDVARAERADRMDPSKVRLLALRAELDAPLTGAVVVTVATPVQPFRDFQRAGEVVEVFSSLEAETSYVSGTYLLVYVAFLLSVIVVALAVGIVISRRVTRRVAVLADATAQVGAGNLTVVVPTGANDEVGELTRAFNDMVADLRDSRTRIDYLQRIGAWQEFARRLAHEIKNPLTPIQLAVQEVHTSYDGTDERHRKRLEQTRAIVEEEVATLRRLVTEFSAFAKLPEARLEPADLGEFVRDAMKSVGAEPDVAEAAAVKVDLDIAKVATPVRIDAMMLKRGLDNLVRNAVQAIRAARPGGEGRVVVVTRVLGNEATLEVSDDGPGVPEADRARVFDPYFTTKEEGTGLGLAIVKKVVLEHGGEIECEASPTGGALFRIRLPLAGRAVMVRSAVRRATTTLR